MNKKIENEKKIPVIEINEKIISIILNQTNYNKKTAIEKLKKWDNNHINVIKEYINPNFKIKKKSNKKTNNQKMFSQIRSFMDSIKY